MLHMRASLLLCVLITASAIASGPSVRPVPREVTFITNNRRLPDIDRQAALRGTPGWRQFRALHGAWAVEFNEATGLPHRAYGAGVATSGSTPEERAMGFLATSLAGFNLPLDELELMSVNVGRRITHVHFKQRHEELPVLFSKVTVKLDASDRVVAFGVEMQRGIGVALTPSIPVGAAHGAAIAGLANVQNVEVMPGLSLLGVPDGHRVEHKLVYTVKVATTEGEGMPGRYECLVDALTGELLYRHDRVMRCGHDHGDKDMSSDVTVTATVYEEQPYIAPTVQPLRNLEFTVNGNTFGTDANGSAATGIVGPVNGTFRLEGAWSSVRTNNVVPQFVATLQDGQNNISFDGEANIRELSAYFHVNIVHDHCVATLPGFTGMDFSLPTNVDVNGNCNAFYDGSSINFYAEGNDCHSWAQLGEVVYHEYGHGINDVYYQDNGAAFQNGGMNEGYADIWALTITWDPILAEGNSLILPNDYIRRYDEAPKVYPVDITGEVHADGEIIAGAWWDLYENINDQALLLQLWADAFAGLQADVPNGDEGTAFRDVLLDVLAADDNDANILNGTPNGTAIIEAFAEHGITLLSNVELDHAPLLSNAQNDDITIEADLTILSADQQYLGGVSLFYEINDGGTWTEVVMNNTGGNNYEGNIPGQPVGTVVAYYIAAKDVFGFLSGVQPIGAAQADPNLPYYILVGYDLEKTEDADNNNELGDITMGLPTDNNTTGDWTLNDPNPSLSTVDNSEIQSGDQHTPGGQFCYFTGQAAIGAGPGENDVDGGHTTLITDPIDLTDYTNPTFTYWRWYTNNPPGGANPGADWWQVEITNNGTNWVFVENSKTSERNWRRRAFRVQDFVTPNSTVQLRFIASDSTHTGQNLDGGSLIEAMVDDIQLWDNTGFDAVGEVSGPALISVYPAPSGDVVNIRFDGNGHTMTMEVVDALGQVVRSERLVAGSASSMLDVSSWADGLYVVRLRWQGGTTEQRFTVLH